MCVLCVHMYLVCEHWVHVHYVVGVMHMCICMVHTGVCTCMCVFKHACVPVWVCMCARVVCVHSTLSLVL